MSQHQFFRRAAVPAQVAQQLQTTTIPAPTRGIIQNENEAFMQPGGAVICDNWRPTMKGLSLRGGCVLWAQLPETTPVVSSFEYVDATKHMMFAANATKLYDVTASSPAGGSPPWKNLTAYKIGDRATDTADSTVWIANSDHITGAAPLTFAQFRTAAPTVWTLTTAPPLVKAGQTSGNYAASQMANASGNWLIAVNDAGDPPLRFNGTTWTSLATTTPTSWVNSGVYVVGNRALDTTDYTYWKCLVAHTASPTGTFNADRTAHPTYWALDIPIDGGPWIVGPPGSAVETGRNLVYVCKYRGRFYFIELNSMNAWYLPLNSVGGALFQIPLSGAATKGGKLLFCASWSIDAGDGIDDKLVFATDQGELLIFTGGDPGVAASWRQEGRYDISPPLGMNAHILIGGELMVATVDGIVPVSGAITKSRTELELAAITRTIKPMWREEVTDKREYPWTMFKWDEYGSIFTTLPGGLPGEQRCLVTNAATGAHARFTGWDAMCFMKMRENAFFGTQTGQIMQMDRTGYDNGILYVATLVGGWEMFQSPSQTVTWRQARASFSARSREPFLPQLSATTDYVVVLPQPPQAGDDAAIYDVWGEGLWDTAKWDAAVPPKNVIRNTGWVSIGMTGFSHAPIVQVTVAQQTKPEVDLINIAATFERDAIVV